MINLREIEMRLRAGDISAVETNILELIDITSNMVSNGISDIDSAMCLVNIFGIVYENSDRHDLLPEDNIYDLLLEQIISVGYNRPTGFPIVDLAGERSSIYNKDAPQPCVSFMDIEERNKKLEFYKDCFMPNTANDLMYDAYKITARDIMVDCPVVFKEVVSKRMRAKSHSHPDLVGTLDKCKFVTVAEALDKGVDINSPNIKILERDFFGKHIMDGIISPNEDIEVMVALKYDGASVDGDCTNVLEMAGSRGDTEAGLSTDLTDILRMYPFVKAPYRKDTIGIQFEAIMRKDSVYDYNAATGKSYKNCRTAISGVFGASDSSYYRDYITLVPLNMERKDIPEDFLKEFPGRSRLAAVAFLNSYYVTHAVPYIFDVIRGPYTHVLFMIRQFLQEAEYSRSFMPFMYDGIVVEYTSDRIRDTLGRENFINKYAMAVKFNPLTKQTIVRDIKYTVGKDRGITPMIYYNPVEFFGTIHPKSTGHSYDNFRKLNLHPGDVIDLTYTNDVMPYVSKPENSQNDNNKNPPYEFAKVCPECGAPIVISESGKSAYCSNVNCTGASLAITTSMLASLGFNGFAEEKIKAIGYKSLRDFMESPIDNLGPVDTSNFISMREEIKVKPITDYDFLGCLGFTSVASKTWKLICNSYNIYEICNIVENEDELALKSIKGIGPMTAKTIISEWDYYTEDIEYAITNMVLLETKGQMKEGSLKIRFSGCRNKQLVELLITMGYDASDGSVSKTTDILLVPSMSYTSSSVNAVGPNTKIVPIENFINNMNEYLSI